MRFLINTGISHALECLISYSGFFLTTVNSVIHLDNLCYCAVLIGNRNGEENIKANQNANSWSSGTINLKPVIPDLMWGHKMAERLNRAQHWFFRNVMLALTHGQFPGQPRWLYHLHVFVRSLLSTPPPPHRSEGKVK